MRDRFNAAGGGLPGGGPAQAGQGPRGARGGSPCRAEQAQSAAGTPSIEMIDNILRFRAKRRTLFSPDLFGEPAWEILLELYRGELGGKRLRVLRTRVIDESTPPGEPRIGRDEDGRLVVRCGGGGTLQLLEWEDA